MWTIKRFPAFWLLPTLFLVAAFTLFPIAHALWTSLHQVMLLFPGEDWVGIENYRTVVGGDYFSVALRNSLLFTLWSAPLVVVIGTAAGPLRQSAITRSYTPRSDGPSASTAPISIRGAADPIVTHELSPRSTRPCPRWY